MPAAIASPLDPSTPIWPQRPTDGAHVLDAGIGLRIGQHGAVHTVALSARNVTDATWRDHLSRIKDVAPQPGRNVHLTYRVDF